MTDARYAAIQMYWDERRNHAGDTETCPVCGEEPEEVDDDVDD